MLAHFGLQPAQLRFRDVRRIRHHQVEGAGAEGSDDVARDAGHARRMAGEIRAGDGERALIDVARRDLRVRQRTGQRRRDRPASGPEVEDPPRRRRHGERRLDDELRLRPRDEDAPVDGEGQRPELALAEEVVERLARDPPGDERLEAGGGPGRKRLARARNDPRPACAERVREQHLGVGPRLGDAGGRQPRDRRSQHRADRRRGLEHGARHPAASSASAWWRVVSASMIASSSPSSTRSSVCSVRLARWSVIRLCGKL